MNDETIKTALRMEWHISLDSRIDLVHGAGGTFRATEVKPDLSTGRRLFGYLDWRIGGLALTEEPDLSLAQWQVYEHAFAEWSRRLAEAERLGQARVRLMWSGGFPDLFDPRLSRPNVAGNVRDGMLPVWHSLEDWLRERGYIVSQRVPADGPWEFWAYRCNT